MMTPIKKTLIFTPLLVLTLLAITTSYALADDANKLYKWKDKNDQWHYSKLPPNQTGKEIIPENLEIAKDAKTIIFEKKADEPITNEEKQQLSQEQQERLQKQACRSTQNSMMDTANFYRKTLDQKLQEKTITLDQYNKETLSINRLEEIGSDLNFFDYCMAGFTNKPQYKTVTDCIVTSDTAEKRIKCLKELPQIE